MSTAPADLDLIRELQLRTWARANHVPLLERDASWHSVVLDEMRRRDAESIEAHLAS